MELLDALPPHSQLFSLLSQITDLLESEVTDYRPAASDGRPGGLVLLDASVPSVIVPDLHARDFFVRDILDFVLPPAFIGEDGISVGAALSQKRLNLVFVGDAIHSEVSRSHWQSISDEFCRGLFTGPVMTQEMIRSFSTLTALFHLKLMYREHFFFLKGNHENVLNATVGCDFAFRKYADEGEMVKLFIQEYYGDDILYCISLYEQALPFVACGRSFVVSHAEPAGKFRRADLVDAPVKPSVGRGLIWTKNDEVTEPTASFMLRALLGKKASETAVYFGGHRAVRGSYALRQNGKFIQIHNPFKENVALVYNTKSFNPDTDIVGVANE